MPPLLSVLARDATVIVLPQTSVSRPEVSLLRNEPSATIFAELVTLKFVAMGCGLVLGILARGGECWASVFKAQDDPTGSFRVATGL